jgi:hypothetical protein
MLCVWGGKVLSKPNYHYHSADQSHKLSITHFVNLLLCSYTYLYLTRHTTHAHRARWNDEFQFIGFL